MKKSILIYFMCLVIILTMASCKNKAEQPIDDPIVVTNDSSADDFEQNTQNDSSIDVAGDQSDEGINNDTPTGDQSDEATNKHAPTASPEDDWANDNGIGDEIPIPEQDTASSDNGVKENEQTANRTGSFTNYGTLKSITDYTDEDFIITNYDIEGMSINTVIYSERDESWSPPELSFAGLQNHIISNNGLIIRGVKKENSTQYNAKDGMEWYSETPIEILEVYYGDANIGDSILVYEKAAVWENHVKEKSVVIREEYPPMKKGTEYILFVTFSESYSRSGRMVFVPYEVLLGNYGRGRFEITDKIKNAKSSDEAGLKGFAKEVFDTYYYK